jgi:hypothetical protein
MSREQKYYELLARTDHPVFKRDLAAETTADSPFNSIFNRLLARQLEKLRLATEEIEANKFPHTCRASGIDQWEETYFGFTKTGLDLETRKDELLLKINGRIRMSAPDVEKAAKAITGLVPRVIRNLYFDGWVLGSSALGIDTILSGANQAVDSFTYVVVFDVPVDGYLLKKLDDELTKIEKGGSTHVIIAPPKLWVLNESALSVDTLLG